MNKLILLVVLCAISISLTAQEGKHLGPFKIKKIDLMVGLDSDRIKNFDPTYFTDQVESNVDFPFEELSFNNPEFSTAVCENPHFRFGFTLGIPKLDRIEWRNAVNWMPNRIDQIDYYQDNINETQDYFGNPSGYSSTFLSLNQTQSEIAIETAFIYTLVDKNIIKVYTGFGSNTGVSYNNHIYIYGYNSEQIDGVAITDGQSFSIATGDNIIADYEESYFDYYSGNDKNTKSQINHRIFAQAGVSIIIFKRVELGVDLRRGIGSRMSLNAPIQLTNLVSSGISLRYILK